MRIEWYCWVIIKITSDISAERGSTAKEPIKIYSVRPGGTHSYQSGIATDPITGQQTPTYGTCFYSYQQYRGIWRCKCGSTNGYYYYPDEEAHSACPLSGH